MADDIKPRVRPAAVTDTSAPIATAKPVASPASSAPVMAAKPVEKPVIQPGAKPVAKVAAPASPAVRAPVVVPPQAKILAPAAASPVTAPVAAKTPEAVLAAPAAPVPVIMAAAPKPAENKPVEPIQPKPVETVHTKETTMNETITSAANGAADAIKSGAANAYSNGKAALEQVTAKSKETIESGMKSLDEMSTMTKGNVEALLASTKAATAGLETIAHQVAEFSRKSFEDTTAVARAMTTVKTPNEFMQLQSDFAKTQFDAAVAEMSRMSETLLKLAGEVFEPVQNRMALATDKVKSAMGTGFKL